MFDPLHVALSLVELVKNVIQKLPQYLGLQDDRLNDWCDSLAEVMEVVFCWKKDVVFVAVQNVGVRENCLFLDGFTHTILDENRVQIIVIFGKLCQILRVFN